MKLPTTADIPHLTIRRKKDLLYSAITSKGQYLRYVHRDSQPCFYNAKSVTDVLISDSVEHIGRLAFILPKGI